MCVFLWDIDGDVNTTWGCQTWAGGAVSQVVLQDGAQPPLPHTPARLSAWILKEINNWVKSVDTQNHKSVSVCVCVFGLFLWLWEMNLLGLIKSLA